jgi:hypothetical protein
MVDLAGSPYSIFAEWWGDEVSERMLAAPQEQWIEFARYYLAHRRSQTKPDLPGPDAAEIYCSVFSRPDDLYDEELILLGSKRIRALAMYADRIAVRDPFAPLAVRFELVDDSLILGEPPPEYKVRDCLRFLVKMSPLARAGVICFPEAPIANQPDDPEESPAAEATLLDKLLQGIASSDRDLTLDFAVYGSMGPVTSIKNFSSLDSVLDWRLATDPRRLRGGGSASFAAMNVLENLANAEASAPGSRVLMGTPLERSAFELLMRMAGLSLNERTIGISNFAMLPVPILVPPSKTILSVRTSTAFIEFRDNLRRALRMVDNIPSTNDHWLEMARSIVKDELAAGRARLEREIRQSRPLNQLKRAASGLAFTALGAATGAVASGGEPLPSMVGSATAALSAGIASYIAKLPQAQRQRAVLDCYLMFDPQRNDLDRAAM